MPRAERILVQLLSFGLLLLGVIFSLQLASLPTESGNALLFGYSAGRIGMILLIILPAVALAFVAGRHWSLKGKKYGLIIEYRKFLAKERRFLFVLAVSLGSLVVLGAVNRSLEGALGQRVAPLLGFYAFLLFAGIIASLVLGRENLGPWVTAIANITPLTASLIALITVFTFVVFPATFYQTGERSHPDPIPFKEPIAYDLDWEIDSARFYFENGYVGKDLPINLFVFAPLISVDIHLSYRIFTVLTYTAFLFSAFVFPALVSKNRMVTPFMALFGAVGLFSYGLQLELEQGQYNVIVFAFSLLAIYLFHYQKKWRPLAYVLYSVALQMKLWPGIFILMLVDDWRDWKGILRRFGALMAANLAALFILGPRILDFFGYIRTSFYDHIQEYTHSIEGGIIYWGRKVEWIANNGDAIVTILFLLMGACIVAALVKAVRDNAKGVNPFLFFVCVITALLTPTLSDDYKLPILVTPMILYASNLTLARRLPEWKSALLIAATLLLAAGQFITNVSFVVKPDLIKNNLPVLIVMLCVVTMVYLILPKEARRAKSADR